MSESMTSSLVDKAIPRGAPIDLIIVSTAEEAF